MQAPYPYLPIQIKVAKFLKPLPECAKLNYQEENDDLELEQEEDYMTQYSRWKAQEESIRKAKEDRIHNERAIKQHIMQDLEFKRQKEEQERKDKEYIEKMMKEEEERQMQAKRSQEQMDLEFAEKIKLEEEESKKNEFERKTKIEHDNILNELMNWTGLQDRLLGESLLTSSNWIIEDAVNKYFESQSITVKFHLQNTMQSYDASFGAYDDAWDLIGYLNSKFPLDNGKYYELKIEGKIKPLTMEELSQYNLSQLSIVNNTKIIVTVTNG